MSRKKLMFLLDLDSRSYNIHTCLYNLKEGSLSWKSWGEKRKDTANKSDGIIT